VVDCAPGSLSKARITRNDNPLALAERIIDGSVQLVADWPLSGPGHYHLRFELDGDLIEESLWTVEPSKLSTDAFQSLLEDLENRLPVSLAVALQKLGAVTGLALLPPSDGSSLAEEVARLRRTVARTEDGPGLAAIVKEIAHDPHEVLADKEMWVPSVMARRVTRSGLSRAAHIGSNQGDNGIPERLPDARVESSVDVYENRLLKSFLEQVEQRLRRLRSTLASKSEPDLLVEVETLERAVLAARIQAVFLDSVGRLGQTPTQVTMVFVKKPAYRKLFESFLDFRRRSHVKLDEPALEAPLEHLPELYEKWATLIAIEAVLELGAELGYVVTAHRLFRHGHLGAWIEILPDGRPAVELQHPDDATKISVVPQRAYSSGGSPLRSISFQQKPDLAIEVERPDGTIDLYLLDPKYKLDSEGPIASPDDGRPKKVDIDKMHAYRDAIRDADGRRVVQFASILYPGQSKFFDRGLAALSAVPGAGHALTDEIKTLIRPGLTQLGLATATIDGDQQDPERTDED
jgi:hypothetical protein